MFWQSGGCSCTCRARCTQGGMSYARTQHPRRADRLGQIYNCTCPSVDHTCQRLNTPPPCGRSRSLMPHFSTPCPVDTPSASSPRRSSTCHETCRRASSCTYFSTYNRRVRNTGWGNPPRQERRSRNTRTARAAHLRMFPALPCTCMVFAATLGTNVSTRCAGGGGQALTRLNE